MSKTKILIVEDEKIVALDIQKQLSKNGYEVCGIYGSGEETLANVGSKEPDLILMDIQLQGKLDGVETAGEIKKQYHIPIIFLTAYADDQTIERAKITEPFGYITKPFEGRALHTTIEMALYKSSIDKKLSESEERYRQFFEEDLSGDIIFTPEGELEDCNPAFIRMLKFPDKKTALSVNVNTFFPEKEVAREFWESLHGRKTMQLKELQLRTYDKSIITVLANVIGTFHEGKLVEGKGYLINITKRKELEEELRHAQKMEAVGRLAGGVAHDFNNILTVMLGYSAVIQDKAKAGEEIDVDIESIKDAIQRAVKLTKQLLLFSRKEVLHPQIVDINALTKDLARMLNRLIPENITIQFFLDAGNPFVYMDPGQLEQVLINLVVNAKDAIHNGGRIVVATENLRVEQKQSAANGLIEPGNYAAVSVSDNGGGIKKEDLQKIFEPFFTTKPQGEGTGLGLSTVYGIINQNNGYIKVNSTVSKGTEFVLYFPETKEKEWVSDDYSVPEDKDADGETILVVEDDDNVRRIVTSILIRKGYNVLEARNGGEAILLCEKRDHDIDLLLTDYILPIINGDELALRLSEIIPGLAILLMTAEADFEREKITVGGKTVSVLKKPFENHDLTDLVYKTLHN